MRKYIIPTTEILTINAQMSMMLSVSSKPGFKGISDDVLDEFDIIK